MRRWTHHYVLQHSRQIFCKWIVPSERDPLVAVRHLFDRLDECGSGAAEHLEETTLVVGVEHLLDRNLTFPNFHACVCLDLVLQLDD